MSRGPYDENSEDMGGYIYIPLPTLYRVQNLMNLGGHRGHGVKYASYCPVKLFCESCLISIFGFGGHGNAHRTLYTIAIVKLLHLWASLPRAVEFNVLSYPSFGNKAERFGLSRPMLIFWNVHSVSVYQIILTSMVLLHRE